MPRETKYPRVLAVHKNEKLYLTAANEYCIMRAVGIEQWIAQLPISEQSARAWVLMNTPRIYEVVFPRLRETKP